MDELNTWIVKNPAVAAAIVAGVVSVVVTLLTQWLQPWQQRRLEQMKADLQTSADEQRNLLQRRIEEVKSQLEERRDAASARRDYEYEARKRLYAEIEPVRFHLYEALEEAHYRVRSLARTARSGNLEGPQAWLERPGYYLRSTMYKLVAPAAQFRLLQRQMTFVDFMLDPAVALQYSLLKLYVRSFTDDFDFAALAPSLRYLPNHADPRDVARDPTVFGRQALVLGDLEAVSDLLICTEDGRARAMRFSEFENLFRQEPMSDDLQEAVNLFLRFSPQRKPVLARLLTAQAYFTELILSTYRDPVAPADLPARLEAVLTDQRLAPALSWTPDGTLDVEMVRAYWAPRVGHLRENALLERF
jgi:hypothetical protein